MENQMDFIVDALTNTAKTKLIEHYIQTLGACVIGGQRMAILEREAHFLINKYYNS